MPFRRSFSDDYLLPIIVPYWPFVTKLLVKRIAKHHDIHIDESSGLYLFKVDSVPGHEKEARNKKVFYVLIKTSAFESKKEG